ncbi:MAG: Gfo/Idh/MocA family oxidoreductase [Gemmatimonadetes bacterium]|nr:Gfo/Idh/MocA family oxidoreductase [Gemmatimonadota bacterium]MDQ3308750.1 Gfo/Idh/MocA family oxidoreductase [Gemmatimonadota bacterium]
MKTVKLGIIGGGLMGREIASAIGRWFALEDYPVHLELVAVCDLQEALLDWFHKVPTVRQRTQEYAELLANPDVDIVYVAVPHDLHERIYLDVLRAGKDLFAEKPFGIDLRAAEAIRDEAETLGRFVRCSSEFPFLPGPQRVVEAVRSGGLGTLLEIRAGFLHSSDLDPRKPINWKRQVTHCGEIGVMGDLGIHVVHLPFRLGWRPESVHAQLVNLVTERPDGRGGMAPCDTWDNAILHTTVSVGDLPVPMTLEMKRMAPGETNTWYVEVAGMEGAVRYSTKEPKTLWSFRRDGEQWWRKTDLGFQTPFKTITGGIFEPGFPDVIQQMLAAFVAEREGFLGDRFGCVTPEEAVASHALFAAALESHRNQSVVPLG